MRKISYITYTLFSDILGLFPGIYLGTIARRIFYKIHLKKCGKNLRVSMNATILDPRQITIGDNVRINRGAWINGGGGLEIGNWTGIGPNTIIHTSNHNYSRRDIPYFLQGSTLKKVIISDDVWIGAGSIILPGVTIGKGAIIAAGSVVSKNVEPFTLVAGVPAKYVKDR